MDGTETFTAGSAGVATWEGSATSPIEVCSHATVVHNDTSEATDTECVTFQGGQNRCVYGYDGSWVCNG